MGNQEMREITLKPSLDKSKNISFGGEKEKAMIEKIQFFRYFMVCR